MDVFGYSDGGNVALGLAIRHPELVRKVAIAGTNITNDDLAPGMLLAAPSLHDPNFERSVVLLGRSGGDGALGWVINGRELMSVRELFTSSELVPKGVTMPRTAVFSRIASRLIM